MPPKPQAEIKLGKPKSKRVERPAKKRGRGASTIDVLTAVPGFRFGSIPATCYLLPRGRKQRPLLGSATMGKVARIERLKLRATFYNNLAIGFVITGYAVPYFAFLRGLLDNSAFTTWGGFISVLTSKEPWLLTLLGSWVFILAWVLRRFANRTIEEIEN
jgi:hypothetical protein